MRLGLFCVNHVEIDRFSAKIFCKSRFNTKHTSIHFIQLVLLSIATHQNTKSFAKKNHSPILVSFPLKRSADSDSDGDSLNRINVTTHSHFSTSKAFKCISLLKFATVTNVRDTCGKLPNSLLLSLYNSPAAPGVKSKKKKCIKSHSNGIYRICHKNI